ncbi:MAG: cell division protein ZapA [Nitrospinales bacterium]
MSNRIQVKIYGKVYTLKNSSSATDPREVAALVDAKMKELAKAKASPSTMDLGVLAALNIALELLELKKETGLLQKEVEQKSERLVRMLSKEIKSLESKALAKSR